MSLTLQLRLQLGPAVQHRAAGLPVPLLDPVVAQLERVRCRDLVAHLVRLPLIVLPTGSSCKHGAPRRRSRSAYRLTASPPLPPRAPRPPPSYRGTRARVVQPKVRALPFDSRLTV